MNPPMVVFELHQRDRARREQLFSASQNREIVSFGVYFHHVHALNVM